MKLAEGEVVPEYEVELPPEAKDGKHAGVTATIEGESSLGMEAEEDNDSDEPARASMGMKTKEGLASSGDGRALLP